MTNKKRAKSFKEFLEQKKQESDKKNSTIEDLEKRKNKWLKAVEDLYDQMDVFIVENFMDAGYNVEANRIKLMINEENIGSYYTHKYLIKADQIEIMFNPIGTLIFGAFGRVDMLLPHATIKLIMIKWNKWKIVRGVGSSRELVDLDQTNIVQIFEENL